MWLMNFFKRMRPTPPIPDVVVHDPEASMPHDLDDPFFDRKIQERIGIEIAKAARKETS